QTSDFLAAQPPTRIYAPPHHTGVRTGGIDQNPIEGTDCRCGWLFERLDCHTGHTETRAVIANEITPAGVRVARDNFAAVVHQLRDEGRFASRSGTQIQDSL